MAGTAAVLPEGARLTDFISLGVLTKNFPLPTVHRILEQTGRQSQRQRNLPAHVVVYYVIALALFMQVSYGEVLRCLVEGLEWLGLSTRRLRNTARSGISQARTRLGVEPLKCLYEEVVEPVTTEQTQGARYRNWQLVSLDGTSLDVADTKDNEEAFGRPGSSRGQSSFPQVRLVALVENGSHVLFGAHFDGSAVGETTLAESVVAHLRPGMLCLADRGFSGFPLWQQALKSGADLLWRVCDNRQLPCRQRLSDGSYLSRIYPSSKHALRDRKGLDVRVIEYRLKGTEDPNTLYRLITTILDEQQAPATDLASLYHDRWEIENAFDELKTHLRGRQIVLRSKMPDLVRQEIYGLLLAHFAIRSLMHESALKADLDPDRLSFVHAVRVVRRKLPRFVSIPPSGDGEAA